MKTKRVIACSFLSAVAGAGYASVWWAAVVFGKEWWIISSVISGVLVAVSIIVGTYIAFDEE